ncbi:GTPase [Siccirubricoccus sp. KC 17139]|uniref:GTPase n=1 Tax=Siccirubricoccus soli TaxID=2899147 RepID=A0ABT1DC05_9PROT|nr:GTPase [Siccirubricoccus soli]MCO6419434.1 GTPase [Siccirubricoccus soli]MCP2685569.1 GTPase [Siccirubricoccus soli]
MRLKLFRASRMAEAMALVRAELGEEAVILETRRSRGGVEVTAAVEPAEPAEPLLIPPSLPTSAPVAPAAPPPLAPALPPALARHNLPTALAARLAPGGAEDPEAALAARLAAVLGFGPLPDGAARPLLLAGPAGAGKTLTCAKLATRAVLAGQPPLVVTTDGARAGAAEQLAAFTRVLGLTLAVAPAPGTLVKALARRQPGQVALIDTAGCNPFDPVTAAELAALARAVEAAMVLVLPAGLDADEASEIARAYAALGARHLLPTRLDTARRLGGVLAAAACGLLLTEAGTGPGAAEGLTALDPAWLAARLGAWPPAPPPASPSGSADPEPCA